MSKTDVLENVHLFKLFKENQLVTYASLLEMTTDIEYTIHFQCPMVRQVVFSNNVEHINGL